MANGHGGRRVGAGSKPRNVASFVSVDGGRAGDVSPTAPDDLPEEHRAFWNAYAQTAIDARTLTAQTVAAFRLLCELDAEKRETKATIDRDGRTYIKVVVDGAGNEHQELKSHPLKADYSKLAKQVEGLMGRFGLAPFGKPVASAKPKAAAANPWASIVNR